MIEDSGLCKDFCVILKMDLIPIDIRGQAIRQAREEKSSSSSFIHIPFPKVSHTYKQTLLYVLKWHSGKVAWFQGELTELEWYLPNALKSLILVLRRNGRAIVYE